jgi:integrase/recombinase XerD
LLGHDKLETTARYTRVATGMIANVTSPLDLLSQRPKKAKKPQQKVPQKKSETTSTDQPSA